MHYKCEVRASEDPEARTARLDARRAARREQKLNPAPPARPRQAKRCGVPNCTDKHLAVGLCSRHYQESRLADPAAKAKHRDNSRRWRIENPERLRAISSRVARKSTTGFDEDLVAATRLFQNGLCAICPIKLVVYGLRAKNGQPGTECADHYETMHGARVRNRTPGATKHPRGLLCHHCNSGLGQYEQGPRKWGLVLEPYERYLADPPVAQLQRLQSEAAE